MKKVLLIAGCALLCIVLVVALLAVFWRNDPDDGGDDSLVYRAEDAFPTQAGRVEEGPWGYYTVQSGCFAKGDYTALTAVENQEELGALGLSYGASLLGKGVVMAEVGRDVAYGFTAPRDGVVTLSIDILSRGENGDAALSLYKNGVRIWPLSAEAYHVPTTDKAAMVSVKTAVKAGDTLYYRISTDGPAAKLKLSPVVTYEADGVYSAEADLEITRPDMTGAVIVGAGATLPQNCLAVNGRAPSDAVIEITAEDFADALVNGTLDEGTTYRLMADEAATVTIEQDICKGKNCVVYAPMGMTVHAGDGVHFYDLTVLEGTLTVRAGESVTLSGIEAGGGLVIEEAEGLRMEDCRATAQDTALINRGTSCTIVNCCFSGKTALADESAGGNLYEGCVFVGEDVAITLAGSNSTVWYSNIRGNVITAGGRSENLLVAMNRFENLGGVVYENTHNCVVLLNEVEGVSVKDSTNTYVCCNTIYGTSALESVDYLLVTRNKAFGSITQTNVSNTNGDNITDVNARAEYGVNEDLLPHINKDAFINMERKDYVHLSDGSRMTISQYINEKSADGGRLIIAPGAYSTTEGIRLSEIEDCTVYAYGVLYEKYDFFGTVFNVSQCKNYSFRGLTLDMVLNGCGQLIVLEKKDGTVRYRAAAGFLQNHADQTYYSANGDGIGYVGFHAGEDHSAYSDAFLGTLTYDPETKQLTSVPMAYIYERLQPGDMLACRAKGGNVTYLYRNTAVEFEDVTILSGSIRGFYDHEAEEGTILNRVMISPAPAKVIDQSTYEEYLALGKQYGVDTGVYVDDLGNYRGTPAKMATADSTHTSNSRSGIKATSCLFECLSDDGSNQQGFHGRLADYDPATGVITYKQNLAAGGACCACADFAVGDRVYVYTLSGQTVCDTPALSATLQLDAVNGFIHYQVQVDPSAFNHAILESYDLSTDGVCDRRILIDNRSRNGDGFVFENLLVQNIRSRGFLVKCAGNEIKHCSFRNIGMAAIGLIFEPEWGESGICDNTLIAYNYFENTGYMPGQPLLYSPITIHGLGNSADEDFLPYKNIEIIGNVVRDRGTKYALFINSAMDVTVQGNDFGEIKGGESREENPSVYVDYARNIAFDGNTYSAHASSIAESIEANGHVHIHGGDVGDQIPDDPILAESVYTTSFLDNVPTTRVDGQLVQNGAWAVGCAASAKRKPEFQPYKVYIPGWYTMSEDTLWSSAGGINATGYSRFIALESSNVGIRYTAEHSGSLSIRIAVFTPPYPPSADGSGEGYFAIFVNGEMVWPVQGGNYSSGRNWYTITQTTTQEELQSSMADLVLELKQGDELIFLSKRKEQHNSSAFSVCPIVYYTRVDD